MKKRLANLKRLVAVKEQQAEVAVVRLARLEAEKARTRAEEEAVIGALNGDQALHGLFVEAMARHLRSLAETLAVVSRQAEAESLRLRKTTGELRQSEKMLSAASRHYARHLEDARLNEMIEGSAGRNASRSDKPPESFGDDSRGT